MFLIIMLSVMVLSLLWDGKQDRKNQETREQILFSVDALRMQKIQALAQEIKRLEQQIAQKEMEELKQLVRRGNGRVSTHGS